MVSNYTKKINPYLGLLGFLGFLGFIGLVIDSSLLPIPTFYIFFTFFGFFGFYFQGKMSNTLIDERFVANRQKASALANKTALIIIVGVTIFAISLFHTVEPYTMLSLMIATIGLSFGLSNFLEQYLLYRFENEEN